LYLDTAPDRLVGACERDHVSVALALHHMAFAFAHPLLNQLVVCANQLDPRAIPDPLVKGGGLLDVGEQNHHPAVRGDPGKVGTLYLGPIGEVFDRAAHRGTKAVLAHPIRGIPHRLDGLTAPRKQPPRGVVALAQFIELPATALQQHPQRGNCAGFEGGNTGHHVQRDMQRIAHASIISGPLRLHPAGPMWSRVESGRRGEVNLQ
jgi:hypothetical protein